MANFYTAVISRENPSDYNYKFESSPFINSSLIDDIMEQFMDLGEGCEECSCEQYYCENCCKDRDKEIFTYFNTTCVKNVVLNNYSDNKPTCISDVFIEIDKTPEKYVREILENCRYIIDDENYMDKICSFEDVGVTKINFEEEIKNIMEKGLFLTTLVTHE